MRYLYAVLLLLLTGCSGRLTTSTPAHSEPAHSEPAHSDNHVQADAYQNWEVQLKEKAKQKHLWVVVECAPGAGEGDEERGDYWGRAFPKGSNHEAYWKEDGAVPHWIELGSTLKEAGVKLLQAIDGPPNYDPPIRDVPEAKRTKRHVICEMPVQGGER